MQIIAAYSASAIFVFLGVMHFAYTLHDCLFDPKYFRPADTALPSPFVGEGGSRLWSRDGRGDGPVVH